MGGSLSQEEELFISFQWERLLDEVVRTESDVRMSSAVSSQAQPETNKDKGDRKFHLSFREWQSLIGTLESQEEGASKDVGFQFNRAASEACRRLTAEQLNEPLIVLAVHVCCWWGQLHQSDAGDSGTAAAAAGAMSPSSAAADGELEEKLGQLEDLVKRREWHTPEDSGHDDDDTQDRSGEDEEEVVNWGSSSSSSNTSSPPPASGEAPSTGTGGDGKQQKQQQHQQRKRDKVWGAVKTVLRHAEHARHARTPNPTDEGHTEVSASCPREHYFEDVLHLVLSLLQVRRAYAAGDREAEKGNEIFRSQLRRLSTYCTIEQNVLQQRNEENARMDAALAMSARNLRQRPVLDLAFHVVLALCCVLHPEPDVAQTGMDELLYVAAMMGEWGARQREEEERQRHRSRGGTKANPANKIWPLLRQIEQKCVRQQYACDAQAELQYCAHPEEGSSVQRGIYKFYQARMASSLPPAPSFSGAATRKEARHDSDAEEEENKEYAEKERVWQYERSQYIGQDHIWDTISAHFLNADVFEQNKATVLVFFGPSGYGKSELARRVARAMYECRRVGHAAATAEEAVPAAATGEDAKGSTSPPPVDLEAEGKLVFIHMPSFCTRDSIYSLVDPPAAHVGDGILLSALLKEKDAIVVLDEFEKCTADAIQHLWLSAFQKNGSLRSLKKKDRMVSTTQTTFILTCNLTAELIHSYAAEYMGGDGRGTGSSDAACRRNQERLRDLFVKDCKDKCVRLFGEPLVNRMDYFFPFVPYTHKEKVDFVLMQLESILSYQREKKKKRIFVTTRFVQEITAQLKSFHAATVEAIVKPLIVKMNANKWSSVVLTAQRGIQQADRSGAQRDARSCDTETTTFVVVPTYTAEAKGSSTGATFSWESLPNGKACVQKWEDEFSALYSPPSPPKPAQATPPPSLPPPLDTLHTGNPPSPPSKGVNGSSGGCGTSSSAGGAVTGEAVKAYEVQKDVVLDRDLDKEVLHLKQLLLQKDKEIELLKKKVVLLEKMVAVLLCVVLSCLYVISFFIGLKLMLVLACLLCFVLVFVLNMPLKLLWDAAKTLFNFLGPYKSSFLLAVLLAWMTAASRQMIYCS